MTTTEQNYPNSFNREVILDLTLQAFYVYDMRHLEDSSAPRIHDYIPVPKTVKSDVVVNVLDNNGVEVVDGSGDNVTVTKKVTSNRTRERRREKFKYLVTQDNNITIAEYKDYDFIDWKSYDGTGFDFDSYLVTGFNLSGDMMRKKQAIYLLVYCERTETIYGIVNSNVTPVRPSSCLVQAQWDFNTSAAQGKWGTQFEAYKLLLPQEAAPSSGDAFDYGPRVIKTKNKLRGSGDALSLYFKSSAGKDMKLLGWGLLGYKVDNP